MNNPEEFARYIAKINELAFASGALGDEPGDYCEADAWLDAFKDGMTPEEAWAEEVDAMGWAGE